MRIICPHCGFEKEIAAEQIPSNVVRVNCPDCRQPFPLPITPVEHLDDSLEITENASDVQWASAAGATDEEQERKPETHVDKDLSIETEASGSVASQPPASIAARYFALLIDAMLIMIMVLTLRIGLTMLGNGTPFSGQVLLGIIFMLFTLTLSFAYHALFIGVCGQTPGKMLLHIQVVAIDDATMTYQRAMLREVLGKTLSLMFLLGYLMAFFNRRHLAAHDKIADTCVVKLTTETPAN